MALAETIDRSRVRVDPGRAPSGELSPLLLLSATLWAALLAMVGAWLWIDAAARWPVAAMPSRVAGATAGAAGQLVFMCLVADRVFPRAPRWLVRVVEGLMGVGVLVGAVWMALVGLELWLGDG